MRGRVLRSQNSFYFVEVESEVITCRMRGKLKRGQHASDLIVVGDWVWLERGRDQGEQNVVVEVETRHNSFSRLHPGEKRRVEDVLAANVDEVLIVVACSTPAPNPFRIDRFLVIAEYNRIAASVILTKCDQALDESDENTLVFRQALSEYQRIGYKVHHTSAHQGQGVNELRACIVGRTNVVLGSSGVGKSSLLNALYPDLVLRIGEVSRAVEKGKHTTRVAELFVVDAKGTGVIDTPGVREMGTFDVTQMGLADCFPELRSVHEDCKFRDCKHVGEQGCRVPERIESGAISARRYESYQRMLRGAER